jgi:hypothetical protein
MKAMYPHPIDRYRVAAALLNDAIERNRLKIQEIADVSGVALSTAYDLRNPQRLEKRALANEDGGSREAIARIVGQGLKMWPSDIDVFLWLYGSNKTKFEPVEGRELDYWKVKWPGGETKTYSDEEPLRERAKYLLKRACDRWISGQSKEKTPKMMEMSLTVTEKDRLEAEQKLVDFQRGSGHMMSVLRYPNYLTWPRALIDKGKFAYPIREGMGKFAGIRFYRWGTFRADVTSYGVREIISKRGFMEYMTNERMAKVPQGQSRDERRQHIENIIQMLKEYEWYEVMLTDAEVAVEMTIKSTKQAVMRVRGSGEPMRNRVMCGPDYVFFDQPIPVMRFLVEFEYEWKSGNKEEIIDWLQWLSRAPQEAVSVPAATVPLECSFCGKGQSEVAKLIAAPRACICNECMAICNKILSDDQQGEGQKM